MWHYHFIKFFSSFLTILIQFVWYILQSYYQVPQNCLCDYLCYYIYIYDCFKRGSLSFWFLSSFVDYGTFLLFFKYFIKYLTLYFLILAINISWRAYWCYFTPLLVFRYWISYPFNFSTWFSNKLLLWNYFVWTLLFECLLSL